MAPGSMPGPGVAARQYTLNITMELDVFYALHYNDPYKDG